MAYWSYAVTNTVAGMDSGPTWRITSSPVTPGIRTSRNTRSGLSLRIAVTASSPLSAVPTTSTPASRRSRSSSRTRPSGSSSTMSTRRGGSAIDHALDADRQPHLGHHAAGRGRREREALPRPIQPLQPGNRVADPHARRGRRPTRRTDRGWARCPAPGAPACPRRSSPRPRSSRPRPAARRRGGWRSPPAAAAPAWGPARRGPTPGSAAGPPASPETAPA